MFDIGWTELLIFAVVTLIFVGPKELPVLMRTVGRYFGMVRQQADEFRRHFDAAMQEAEFDRVRAELDSVGKDLNEAVQDHQASLSTGPTDPDTTPSSARTNLPDERDVAESETGPGRQKGAE